MKKGFIWGFLGGVGLLFIYFLVMGLASSSWDYTIRQFIITSRKPHFLKVGMNAKVITVFRGKFGVVSRKGFL